MNEKLRMARMQKLLSESEICSAIGADLKTYQNWELGKHIPQPYFRKRLCEFFGMSLEDLGYDPATLLAKLPSFQSAARGMAEATPQKALTQPSTDQLPSIYILTVEEAASLQSVMRGQNINMNEFRRKLLQLGISGTAAFVMAPLMDSSAAGNRLHDDYVALLENELKSRWMLYYTGGATQSSIGSEHWLQEVVRSAQLSRGTLLYERAHLVLCMSYQLQGCILRDLLRFPEAHQSFRSAFLIAQELHNPELMAASLAREGVTLTQQDQANEAVRYLNQAHEVVKHLGFFTLEGYILQGLSEAQAKDQSQTSWTSLECAERLLSKKSDLAEHSFTRFSAASVMAQRGVNAALLQDYTNCIELIDKGLKTYDATLVRGRARLIMQKAEAYWALGQIDACTLHTREAVLLARSAGASRTIERARNLYTTLLQSPHRKDQGIAELSEVISIRSV